MRLYKLERESLLDGAATLWERQQNLDRLADGVNPYWRPIIGRLPDGTPYTSLQAKRDDAAEQAPITFTIEIDIPDDPEHDDLRNSWRQNVELGIGATLSREFITKFSASGPPNLGLPTGDRIPDLIEFVAIPDTEVSGLPTQVLAVYEPGATHPCASLTFIPEPRTQGSAGVRLTAFDPAHTTRLVTDVRASVIHLDMKAVDAGPITPATLLPSLRFCRAIVPPNRLVLSISRNGRSYQEETIVDRPFLVDPPSDELVQFVEDLTVVQNAFNAPFSLPDTFSGRDAHEANRLRRLAEGERVAWLRGPLTVTIIRDKVEQFRQQFVAQPRGWLRTSHDDIQINIGDHVVHTGPVWMLGEMSVDVDAINDDAAGGPPTAVFDVLGDGWLYAQLGTPADEASDSPERPTGCARVAVRSDSPAEVGA